ncbi:hypothetical protein INT48_001867 [Thamnidium elegans]|uniref:SPX domain-containing protein n=1 Tax=Thamnidium elegans TaxID=101142 RepID=A0A8H7SQ90_9FUNG|nr:hypothetical protein INT48_001867 [Thamnidium elegans]
MKFGANLQEAISPEWKPYYLDYDQLKKKLGKAEKEKNFTERDETEFVEMLDSNLEKVYAFYKATMNTIKDEIEACATEISNLEQQDTLAMQIKINQVADDIARLEKFSRINYTGFLKIVKKHDRHTDYILRPMFMVRLNQCPFWKENEDNDALLIKLSELFSIVREEGDNSCPVLSSSLIKDSSMFAVNSHRTVIKRFFVHTDDIFELKTYVLRHLPVLVYRNNDKLAGNEDIDPPISTLYLDNSNMDTYCSRVESAQNSQLIRLRWYGSAEGNKSISVERRTLDNEDRGEVKDKFTIKDKFVNGFLRGEKVFLENAVKKMESSGRKQDDIKEFTILVNSIQKQIIDNHMKPAFQIPGDSNVRMALDTDLCFIREDTDLFPNELKRRRPENCWRRPDADINFPFSKLKDGVEVNRYPYATFEIKLKFGPNESEPQWIVDLQESGLLEKAYQFSKFVHGMAIMFDTRVPLLPYWLAQIEDDRKLLPVLPAQSHSASKPKIKPVADERTALLNQETKPTYASVLKRSISEEGTSQAESSTHANQHTVQSNKSAIVLPPGVKVPKKVQTSIKVEPKVFFANERTFFSWMKFSVILATFSLALFNSGDAVGKICGILYTLVSVSTMMYGAGLYYRRRELIRARLAGPYDEMIGPTIVCFALLFVVGMNAYLKFSVITPQLLYLF